MGHSHTRNLWGNQNASVIFMLRMFVYNLGVMNKPKFQAVPVENLTFFKVI